LINYFTHPKYIEIGIKAKMIGTIIANAVPTKEIKPLYLRWFKPNDWNELLKPCSKCHNKEIHPNTYTITTQAS